MHLVIDYESTVWAMWNSYISLLAIVSSFLYAHYAAYRHEDGTQGEYMIVIEASFAVDFCLQFFLSYPDPRGKHFSPIINLEQIAARYMKGEMIEEALPLIPF
jgi:hypothetical protein